MHGRGAVIAILPSNPLALAVCGGVHGGARVTWLRWRLRVQGLRDNTESHLTNKTLPSRIAGQTGAISYSLLRPERQPSSLSVAPVTGSAPTRGITPYHSSARQVWLMVSVTDLGQEPRRLLQ